MRDAGAEVEIVNLRKKTIKSCIGCFTCWTKTPGKCIHKDDMTNELFPKWLKSDLVVYGIQGTAYLTLLVKFKSIQYSVPRIL